VDVLVFLYRHPISLLAAEHLAPLIGYPSDQVAAALNFLESLLLVGHSRVSDGVRLYRFTAPAAPQRRDAAEHLFALANSRATRVVLSKNLRTGGRTPQEGL
jgi:hypothetical protein